VGRRGRHADPLAKSFVGRLLGVLIPVVGAQTLGRQLKPVPRKTESA
jgi:hypothetical protein